MSSTKALMAAHAERDKEYQSLREQWEVLATAALARDAVLAKTQEEVRRLNSNKQQLSVSSADSAERLAAVTADRKTRLKAAQTMYNVQKEKTARVAKECDYYKNELDTLRALVTTEQEAAGKRALIERYEAKSHSAASGPLLAAYDAVEALQHRVELHRELHAGADVALDELKVYT